MGTGFPSKLLKNHRFCGTAAWQSDHQCLHCHRNRSGKKWHCKDPETEESQRCCHWFWQRKSLLSSGTSHWKAEGHLYPKLHRNPPKRKRNHLLCHQKKRGYFVWEIIETRRLCNPLPRWNEQRYPQKKSGWFHLWPRSGCDCHQCFWHGNRQIQCAFRHPLQHASEHGKLLPGSWPRRTWWWTCKMYPSLFHSGCDDQQTPSWKQRLRRYGFSGNWTGKTSGFPPSPTYGRLLYDHLLPAQLHPGILRRNHTSALW